MSSPHPASPCYSKARNARAVCTFTFGVNVPVEWPRIAKTQSSTIALYRDLIAVRRNKAGNTAGLEGPHIQIDHIDDTTHTLAYHRWTHGSPGDDVIVLANFSATAIADLKVKFPHLGVWKIRFDSGRIDVRRSGVPRRGS